jgi:hypothetical protein
MYKWQFILYAVCRESGTTLPPPLREVIESHLANEIDAQAIKDGLLMYGSQQGNRIDLVYNDHACGLAVSVDVRSDAESFIALVCLLTSKIDCALYSPEIDDFVPADTKSVMAALQESAAWGYAVNGS